MPEKVFGPNHVFLQKEEILTFEEIILVAEAFACCGGKKIRLTGGEPLLRPNLPELVRSLRAIGGIKEIALTTNGLLLPKHAAELKAAGLDRVTLSLDSLDEKTFRRMSGRDVPVQKALEGIRCAEEAGLTIKVNAVIIRHQNEDQVLQLAEHFRGTAHVLRFIEFMDVGNCNQWTPEKVYTGREILRDLQAHHEFEPIEANHAGEVANRYRYCDGLGEFGIIASVSQPFCGNCNRARLSADGKLFTCLFATSGVSLRDLIRKGGDIIGFLHNHWGKRSDRYSELRGTRATKKVEMSYLGG